MLLCALLGSAPKSQPLVVLHARLDGYVMAVPVSIGGKTFWFDLDTGGLHTIVDGKAAEGLRLPVEGSVQVGGAGKGAVHASRLQPFPIRLGGVTFYPRDPLALDLSGVGSTVGERGLLGFDFFERYVVVFDYDRRTVSLYDPPTYRYDGSGARVPLVIRPPRAFVSVVVSAPGVAPERHTLRLDSGSSDSVDDDIVLRSTEPKKTITGGVGIGSRFRTYLAPVSSLEVGPYTLHDELLSATGGVQLIGSQVWHRFNVVFDFSRQCMYLAPRQRGFS